MVAAKECALLGGTPPQDVARLSGTCRSGLSVKWLCVAPAYTGLKVDIDRIRADNLQKVDVQRKSGLIIRSGGAGCPPRPRRSASGVS